MCSFLIRVRDPGGRRRGAAFHGTLFHGVPRARRCGAECPYSVAVREKSTALRLPGFDGLFVVVVFRASAGSCRSGARKIELQQLGQRVVFRDIGGPSVGGGHGDIEIAMRVGEPLRWL